MRTWVPNPGIHMKDQEQWYVLVISALQIQRQKFSWLNQWVPHSLSDLVLKTKVGCHRNIGLVFSYMPHTCTTFPQAQMQTWTCTHTLNISHHFCIWHDQLLAGLLRALHLHLLILIWLLLYISLFYKISYSSLALFVLHSSLLPDSSL